MKICPKCHKSNRDDTDYCVYCHARIYKAAPADTAAPGKSSTPGTTTAGWAMPLALAGLFLVLFGDMTIGGALSVAALARSIDESSTTAKRLANIALVICAVTLLIALIIALSPNKK